MHACCGKDMPIVYVPAGDETRNEKSLLNPAPAPRGQGRSAEDRAAAGNLLHAGAHAQAGVGESFPKL